MIVSYAGDIPSDIHFCLWLELSHEARSEKFAILATPPQSIIGYHWANGQATVAARWLGRCKVPAEITAFYYHGMYTSSSCMPFDSCIQVQS